MLILAHKGLLKCKFPSKTRTIEKKLPTSQTNNIHQGQTSEVLLTHNFILKCKLPSKTRIEKSCPQAKLIIFTKTMNNAHVVLKVSN